MLWYYVRLIFISVVFVSMFFADIKRVECREVAIEGICTIIFFIISLIFVVGLQSRNPYIHKYKWNIPNWYSNFLDIRDPLQFIHFVAYLLLFGGLGCIIKGILIGVYINDGLLLINSSVGLFLGIKICMYLFKDRYYNG